MRRGRRQSRSLTQRMVIALILIILPFNVVSVITILFSLRDARRHTVATLENLSSMALVQFDGRVSAMNDFFYSLDEMVSDFSLYKQQGERDTDLVMAETSLASYFNTIVENKAFADVLFWQSTAYDRIYIGMDSLENEKCEKVMQCKNRLREFLETDEKTAFSQWRILETGGMRWLVKVYSHEGFYYGSMLSLDELEYSIRKGSSFDGMEIGFYEKESEKASDKGRLVVVTESGKGNFRMEVSVPASVGFASLSALQILCIGFVLLYILLIPLLIYLIRRMVLKPLGNVSDAMEHLENGEQDYRISVNLAEAQEFVAIGGTFNSMADRICELRIANYEKEIERQRVELRNLQLQIRPHFLLNMFNLLYSFAQIESYQNIQKLALYLSGYFRYLFQSGRELQPFSQEYGLIQQYLEIAALRYPDCCEVVYEIDPEAMSVEVPPLLIHNFVENIFKHIVNHDRKLHLRIEAYADDAEATFMIADDGPGMPAQMVDDINHGVFNARKDDRVHVGIENSYRRMKYFYGERGSLTVDSEPGQGTCFTIVIPLQEDKDESADCG